MSNKLVKKDEFELALEELKTLHDSKKEDYSRPGNRFSNFEEAAFAANVSPDVAFEVLIGIKTARKSVLTHPDRTTPAKNESVLDTIRDRAIYSILQYVYAKRKKNG